MTAITPSICANSAMSNWPGGSSSKVLLLNTGGYPASSVLSNQTNLFNGTTPNWSANTATVMDPAGPLPGRSGSVLGTYDGTSLLCFGGNCHSAEGFLNDSWLYNGTWTKQTPTTSPSARSEAGLGYLSGTGAVLFGGCNSAETPMEDTWVWTAGNWSQVVIANGLSPAARFSHAMASSSSLVLLFSGALAGNVLGHDTWSYTTSGGWVQKTPATSPQARSGAAMCWDATASLFVLAGGTNSAGVILNDLWTTATGATWTQVTQTGTIPPGKVGAQMAYDSVSGKTILFGGVSATLNEPDQTTFSLTASTGVWTQL